MARFTAASVLQATPTDVEAWHRRPGAFQRLVPPWERVSLLSSEGIDPGSRAVLRVRKGPVALKWTAVHHALPDDCAGFGDVMESGPFMTWRHQHRFEKDGPGTRLVDDIVFEPTGFGPADAIASRLLGRDLRRQFTFRHLVTSADLATHGRYHRPLRFGILGASGLIGRQLTAFLATGGHTVTRFVRRMPPDGIDEWAGAGSVGTVLWDGEAGESMDRALSELDVVVNLAGAPIPATRWTDATRRKLRDSRIETTRALVDRLSRLEQRPSVLIGAAGTAIYGPVAGASEADVPSPAASDAFLMRLCRDWEAETARASEFGMRTASLRIGPVLWPRAGLLGALAATRPIIPVPGNAHVPWVALDDVIGAVLHVASTESITGPVNVVSPSPVPLRVLGDAAGLAVPVPGPLVRLVFGSAADETVLLDQQIRPRVLTDSGYVFRHPEAAEHIRYLDGRPSPAVTARVSIGFTP